MRCGSSKRLVSGLIKRELDDDRDDADVAEEEADLRRRHARRLFAAHSEKPPSNTAKVNPMAMRTVMSGPTRGSASVLPSSRMLKPFAGLVLYLGAALG